MTSGYINTARDPGQTAKETSLPEIPAAVQELESSIKGLFDMCEQVGMKLQSVMTPAPPTNAVKDDQSRAGCSDLGNTIFGNAAGVRRATEQLAFIRDRLAL